MRDPLACERNPAPSNGVTCPGTPVCQTLGSRSEVLVCGATSAVYSALERITRGAFVLPYREVIARTINRRGACRMWLVSVGRRNPDLACEEI